MYGIRVECRPNPYDGMPRHRKNFASVPPVVIAGITRLPGISFDAVREIVKHDPDAKILMCSAMGQQALVVEAIQAGAKDFVVKPFQPSRVLEAVQRVLG